MTEHKLCGFKNNNYTSAGDSIEIPGYLPNILTEWSKAAIRTQPTDLLQWSAIYFRMIANGEHPPVKPYLDPPDIKLGPGALTPNALKALARTLTNTLETREQLKKMWDILSLDENIFLEIIQIGKFKEFIMPKIFIGIAAAYLNNRLRDTMILLCDTLSGNHSHGILLHDFVNIYRFLARLNCIDETTAISNELPEHDEKSDNLEGIAEINGSQCFRSSDSQMSSLDICSCDSTIVENTADVLDTNSTEGIMVWQNDDVDGQDSLTEGLNKQAIKPPLSTTICDDSDYLLSIRKLRENLENDDDLLSLLSDSSIISNLSVHSFLSVSNSLKFRNEQLDFEEIGNEEMISESLPLEFKDYYEKNTNSLHEDIVIDDDINETSIQEISSEDNNESSVVVEYEDNTNDINKSNHNDHNTKVPIEIPNNNTINKDFIVMMALISDDNGPLPNIESDEHSAENESSESEFSLLNKTELNENADEQVDSNKANDQVFEENYFINVGKESTGSEKSSSSNEFQYSEIDQISNTSKVSDKISVQMEGSITYSLSRDDLTDHNDIYMDQLLLNDEASAMSTQFEYMNVVEEGEQNIYPYENENDLDLSKISTVESIKSDKEIIDLKDVQLHFLPGIGPAIMENQIKQVIEWVTKCANNQNNYVQEHNLLHFLCPPLDYKSVKSNHEI